MASSLRCHLAPLERVSRGIEACTLRARRTLTNGLALPRLLLPKSSTLGHSTCFPQLRHATSLSPSLVAKASLASEVLELSDAAVDTSLSAPTSFLHVFQLAEGAEGSSTIVPPPGFQVEATVEAANDVVQSGYTETENFFISALFVLAAAGLVALTVGVAYLAFADWQDKREVENLQKEQEAAKAKGLPKTKPPKSKEAALLPTARGFGKKEQE